MTRILIIKMWAIGDTVMATPLIDSLRARYPDAHIVWAIEAGIADLLRGHPGIDEIVPIEAFSWRDHFRKASYIAWYRQTAAYQREMRRRNFDIVINLHAEKWWTYFLCVAPMRIGLFCTQGFNLMTALYTRAINPREEHHETRRCLTTSVALGGSADCFELTLGMADSEDSFLKKFEQENGIAPDDPMVLLSPFSSSPTKDWEPGQFTELGRQLVLRHPETRIVLTCVPRNAPEANQIAEGISSRHPVIVVSQCALREYVALIRRARIVISGDSAAMHIAAAVGTPFVAIVVSTDPRKVMPLAAEGIMLESITGSGRSNSEVGENSGVTVGTVLSAVEKYMLAEAKASPVPSFHTGVKETVR